MSLQRMVLVALALAMALAAARAQEAVDQLKSEKDIRSYALGMDMGTQLRKLSIDVEPTVFAKGLGDALGGRKLMLSDADAKAAIARLQAEVKAKQMLPPADPKKIK